MRKMLMTAATLAALCLPASAGYVDSCRRGFCVEFNANATAKVLHVERPFDAEADARWEAYCRPTLSEPNALGVQHYLYAHEHCDVSIGDR